MTVELKYSWFLYHFSILCELYICHFVIFSLLWAKSTYVSPISHNLHKMEASAKSEIMTLCNYLAETVGGVKRCIFLCFRPYTSLEVSRMGRPEWLILWFFPQGRMACSLKRTLTLKIQLFWYRAKWLLFFWILKRLIRYCIWFFW